MPSTQPQKKPAPEFLLYRYAVRLTGQKFTDPRTAKVINPQAQDLLMRSFMAAADVAGWSVTINIKRRRPPKTQGRKLKRTS